MSHLPGRRRDEVQRDPEGWRPVGGLVGWGRGRAAGPAPREAGRSLEWPRVTRRWPGVASLTAGLRGIRAGRQAAGPQCQLGFDSSGLGCPEGPDDRAEGAGRGVRPVTPSGPAAVTGR
jgi:hypothetical protein